MSEKKVPHAEPFERFSATFERARATGIDDPNAMVLSTVGRTDDGEPQPSSRVVLLKAHDLDGFVFYTNLESRKGSEVLADPRVGLNLWWRELEEQVRIQGVAQQVANDEADAYFATRPRTSQLGAWASQQSRPLAGRARLLAEVAKLEAKYLGGPVPRPPHWSGFRVVPTYIELWKAGAFRLHDRFAYRRIGGIGEREGWLRWRMYP